MKQLRLAACAGVLALCCAQPIAGPYAVLDKDFNVSALDATDPSAWVLWPANGTATQKFPLLVYLHGLAGQCRRGGRTATVRRACVLLASP